MHSRAVYCALFAALSLSSIALAEDALFYRNTISSVNLAKEADVEFTLSDSAITLKGRKGNNTSIEIPYAKIVSITYQELKHHRYGSGGALAVASPLAGAILMATKAGSHWLTVAYGDPAMPERVFLHLDKHERDDVIAALKTKTGKPVEVGVAETNRIDATFGSKDVSELVAFTPDQLRAALKPAMEAVACNIKPATLKKDRPMNLVCERPSTYSDRTGAGGRVVATFSAESNQTRLKITTEKTSLHSRNWSTLVYDQMRSNLEKNPPPN